MNHMLALMYARQAGNFVREEILSAFIRLVAYTPELQAYTASKLYTALRSDISQESLTLAATWVIGEYCDVLLEGGIVDEDQPKPVRATDLSLYKPFTQLCADIGHGIGGFTCIHTRLTICQLFDASICPDGPYEDLVASYY